MFRALFGWLFGRKPASPPAAPSQAEGFRRLQREAPLRAEEPRAGAADAGATFLCREAVLGRNQRIAGYQFMLQEATRARIRHSSRKIHHVYAEVLARVDYICQRAGGQAVRQWHLNGTAVVQRRRHQIQATGERTHHSSATPAARIIWQVRMSGRPTSAVGSSLWMDSSRVMPNPSLLALPAQS